MAKPLVDDSLWEIIEPLIPVKARRPRFPGRKRVSDRAALTGILFVLKTGIGWEDLPQGTELEQRHDPLATAARLAENWRLGKIPRGVALPVACRRSDRLVASGGRLQQRASSFWGLQTGRNPTDRGKAGSKHHLLTDAQGIPLCVQLTAANVNDTC